MRLLVLYNILCSLLIYLRLLVVVRGEEPPSCGASADDHDHDNEDQEGDEVSLASLLRSKYGGDQANTVFDKIKEKLHEGHLVVIENALPIELADQVYQDLDSIAVEKWPLHQDCFVHGFCYSHHNVYHWAEFTNKMNYTLSLFDHPNTKTFMSELSGRNCYGNNSVVGHTSNPIATASWYMPGDFSLPHTDHIGARTVAFVWHLSKHWQPEWGGALYWDASHDYVQDSFQHASYNSLVLFVVTPKSTHFVTQVSSKSQGSGAKRLAFNGWWTTNWTAPTTVTTTAIQVVEDRLISTEKSYSDREYEEIQTFLDTTKQLGLLNSTRHRRLQNLYNKIKKQDFPSDSNVGIF